VGDKEVADQTLSVRKQSGEDLGSMSVDDFTAMLKQEIADKVINIVKKTEE